MNEVSFIALPLVLLLDRLHTHVCEVELLARPVLLQAVGEVKCFVQFISLEYVNAAAENNLPSMVGGDIPIMFSP